MSLCVFLQFSGKLKICEQPGAGVRDVTRLNAFCQTFKLGAEAVAQLVESLPSIHEALGSFPVLNQTGHRRVSESQYSGGGGSEVQSHPKLHFEFKASLETQGTLSQRKVYIVILCVSPITLFRGLLLDLSSMRFFYRY